jgi:tape measure domain-containing protein
MGTSGIPVAELFARLGLDPSEFRRGIVQAKADLEDLANSTLKSSEKIKRTTKAALESGANPDLVKRAMRELFQAGASVDDVYKVLGTNIGRVTAGLQDTVVSSRTLSGALRNLGAPDIEAKFRLMNESFKVVTEAFDAGEISSRTYQSALRGLGDEANKVTAYLNDADKPPKILGKTWEETGRSLRRAGEDMTYLGGRLTGLLTTPIVAGGVAALKMAGDMELANASMTRMTGNARLAAVTIGRLREFTLTTPFDFKGSLDGARRLQTMGIAATNTIETLRILGDATASVGGDTGTLNRFIKAIGDIQAKGHLAAEEIRQLSNIPIPAVALIANELGITTGEVMDKMKEKAIDAQTAIDALMRGLAQRFGGEMAAQAQTLNVLWKNVKERGEFALRDIGVALTPAVKDLAAAATDILDNVTEMAQAFANLPKGVQQTVVAFAAVAAAAGPVIYVTGSLVGAAGHLVPLFTKLGGVVGGGAIAGSLVAIAAGLGAIAGASSLLEVGGLAGDIGKLASETTNWQRSVSPMVKVAREADFSLLNLTKRFIEMSVPVIGARKGIEEGRAVIQAMRGDAELAAEAIDLLKRKIGERSVAGVGQLTPTLSGDGFTNSMKERIDREVSSSIDSTQRAKEEAIEAAKKVKASFADIGIEDHVSKINEMMAAYQTLSGRISGTQRQIAANSIIAELNSALENGAISVNKYLSLLDRVEGKVTRKDITPASASTDADAAVYRSLAAAIDEASESYDRIHRISTQALISQLDINEALRDSTISIERFNSSRDAFRKPLPIFEPQSLVDFKKHAGDLDILGVKSRTNLGTMADSLRRVKERYDLTGEGLRELREATLNYYREAKAQGVQLTSEQENSYRALLKQVNAVKLFEQGMLRFGRQVSTIWSDFGKAVVDIFIPTGSNNNSMFGLDISVIRQFEEAFKGLASQGFSNPAKAMKDIIAQIQAAGSTAEANRIAIRHFGQEGAQIATLLRNGTIEGERLVQVLTQAAKSFDGLAEGESKMGKFNALVRETGKAIVRAFIEEGARAITEFSVKHLKVLLSSLDDVIAKIPIIGRGLAGIFGGGGGAAVGSIGSIPGGSGPLPTGPGINIPGLPGPPSGSTPPTGGTGGIAGSAGGLMGTLGVVGSLGSMVTGVISNFQNYAMNKSLDIIVKHTLGTQNELSNLRADEWARESHIMLKLDDMWNEIRNVVSAIGGGGTAGGMVTNIYIDGIQLGAEAGNAYDSLRTGIEELKRRGVIAQRR